MEDGGQSRVKPLASVAEEQRTHLVTKTKVLWSKSNQRDGEKARERLSRQCKLTALTPSPHLRMCYFVINILRSKGQFGFDVTLKKAIWLSAAGKESDLA